MNHDGSTHRHVPRRRTSSTPGRQHRNMPRGRRKQQAPSDLQTQSHAQSWQLRSAHTKKHSRRIRRIMHTQSRQGVAAQRTLVPHGCWTYSPRPARMRPGAHLCAEVGSLSRERERSREAMEAYDRYTQERPVGTAHAHLAPVE